MRADDFLNAVKGKLIVSCQALAEEPLHGSAIMAKMGHRRADWRCGGDPCQ